MSGEKPRMLVSVLECTEQSPMTKNYLAPSVSSAKVEKC